MTTFFARKAHNNRNGDYWSLRLRVPSGNDIEWGRLRKEVGGWSAWAEDRDFDRYLKAALVRAGRDCPFKEALAALKAAYIEWGED